MENLVEVGNTIVKHPVDEKMVKDFLFTSETKLTDKQQQMFMQIAIRHNLDPFKREIYAIAFGKEFSIVTGYQVYIERAEASGNLDGWNCVNTEEGAKITIYRKDWQHPFEWEATYNEFDKGQSSWSKMRNFMIKKVCIGQGFRLAFPAELGGMPYFKEEMEGAAPFNNSKAAVKTTQSKSDNTNTNTGKEGKVDTGEVFIKVDRVTIKNGTNEKTGKDWTRYHVHSVGGTEYKTFSETIAKDAKKIQGADIEALVLYKQTKYGNDIESFEVQE